MIKNLVNRYNILWQIFRIEVQSSIMINFLHFLKSTFYLNYTTIHQKCLLQSSILYYFNRTAVISKKSLQFEFIIAKNEYLPVPNHINREKLLLLFCVCMILFFPLSILTVKIKAVRCHQIKHAINLKCLLH